MREIKNNNAKCWSLYDDQENPVSNFEPKVLRVDEVLFPSEKEIALHIKIIFITGDTKEVQILENDLKKIRWEEIDCRCVVYILNNSASKFLLNYIRCQLSTCPYYTRVGIEKQGLSQIDETQVFLAGDKLIVPSTKPELKHQIRFRSSSFRLDIDENISLEDSFKGIMQLINLSPEIGRILIAHIISGFIRSGFKEIGFIPNSVLIVVGESGMLKTSYVSHMAQLYNRRDEIKPVTRFNSTTRFIEDVLYDYSECTAVIDDIHTGSSSGIKKNNESTAEELIRRIGDNTGKGYKEGKTSIQKSFNGNAIFIGEYMNGKGSSIPRTLVVKLTQRINGVILDKYQRQNKLLVSTFYYHFLRWYVDYYQQVCQILNNHLTKHRSCGYETGLHARLPDTYFYLMNSYAILLEFCRTSNLLSNEDVNTEFSLFSNQLKQAIYNQQMRYSTCNTNYLSAIANAYSTGKIRVAKSADEFNENIHDAVLHYGCLCIYSKCFDSLLAKFIPDYKHREVIRYLKDNNALKLHDSDNKNDVKIFSLNKRFFSIYLHKLK